MSILPPIININKGIKLNEMAILLNSLEEIGGIIKTISALKSGIRNNAIYKKNGEHF